MSIKKFQGLKRVFEINVRYHHTVLHKEWRKAAEPWFTLFSPPPYSSDLNPIERVWKLNRRVATHNKYLPPIDDMIASAENISLTNGIKVTIL